MWIYEQSTGRLFKDVVPVATGYSGHAEGVNAPTLESKPDIGPIPQGFYTIGKAENDHATGPVSLPLIPDSGTNTFHRSGFRIHGDSTQNAGRKAASHGCIVIDRATREDIDRCADDRQLHVVAHL